MNLRLLCSCVFSLALVAPYAVGADAGGNKEKKAFKAACPISGEPAKESVSVKFQGKDVYLCCKKCVKGLKAKTSKKPIDEKLLASIRHQWLQTGRMVQVGCPLSGKEVNPKTAVEFKGVKFSFCCKKCKARYEKASDDEKLMMVFGRKSKGFTTQIKCPLTGKPIDASVSTDYKGRKVYFCCPGCIKKFNAAPEKYEKKLGRETGKKAV